MDTQEEAPRRRSRSVESFFNSERPDSPALESDPNTYRYSSIYDHYGGEDTLDPETTHRETGDQGATLSSIQEEQSNDERSRSRPIFHQRTSSLAASSSHAYHHAGISERYQDENARRTDVEDLSSDPSFLLSIIEEEFREEEQGRSYLASHQRGSSLAASDYSSYLDTNISEDYEDDEGFDSNQEDFNTSSSLIEREHGEDDSTQLGPQIHQRGSSLSAGNMLRGQSRPRTPREVVDEATLRFIREHGPDVPDLMDHPALRGGPEVHICASDCDHTPMASPTASHLEDLGMRIARARPTCMQTQGADLKSHDEEEEYDDPTPRPNPDLRGKSTEERPTPGVLDSEHQSPKEVLGKQVAEMLAREHQLQKKTRPQSPVDSEPPPKARFLRKFKSFDTLVRRNREEGQRFRAKLNSTSQALSELPQLDSRTLSRHTGNSLPESVDQAERHTSSGPSFQSTRSSSKQKPLLRKQASFAPSLGRTSRIKAFFAGINKSRKNSSDQVSFEIQTPPIRRSTIDSTESPSSRSVRLPFSEEPVPVPENIQHRNPATPVTPTRPRTKSHPSKPLGRPPENLLYSNNLLSPTKDGSYGISRQVLTVQSPARAVSQHAILDNIPSPPDTPRPINKSEMPLSASFQRLSRQFSRRNRTAVTAGPSGSPIRQGGGGTLGLSGATSDEGEERASGPSGTEIRGSGTARIGEETVGNVGNAAANVVANAASVGAVRAPAILPGVSRGGAGGNSLAASPMVQESTRMALTLMEKMEGMGERMECLEEGMSRMEVRMSRMEEWMSRMEEWMSRMEEWMNRMEEKMMDVESKVSVLEARAAVGDEGQDATHQPSTAELP